MGLYGWYLDRVVPRIVEVGMRGEQFAALRPTCVGAARGRVLELGFGSGHNLPHYGPDVEELVAADPALFGRELAAERIDAAPFPVRFADLIGDRLDVPDASFDTVTCTFSLCTIPAVETALAEVRRILRPGGSFLFLEHGLAPDPKVARAGSAASSRSRRSGPRSRTPPRCPRGSCRTTSSRKSPSKSPRTTDASLS